MQPLFEAFNRRKNSADVVEIIPEGVELVRRIMPQLRKLRGQSVMVVLGFCLKPQTEGPYKTDRIIHALEMEGQNPTLLLDLRNECRRVLDDTGCKPISEKELEVLMASKAFELQVAQEEFQITVRSVFSFSGCWDNARFDRIIDALSLAPPPYYHESRHVSWMSHYQLFAFAQRISDTVMQDWSQEETMSSFGKAGLLDTRLVPRIPVGFGEKFRSTKDIVKSEDSSKELPTEIKSKWRPLRGIPRRRVLQPERDVEDQEDQSEQTTQEAEDLLKLTATNPTNQSHSNTEDTDTVEPGRKRQKYVKQACQNCRDRKAPVRGIPRRRAVQSEPAAQRALSRSSKNGEEATFKRTNFLTKL